MKIKKFDEKQAEKIENAKQSLKVIDEIASIGSVSPDIKKQSVEINEVLEDPYVSTKNDVKNIVETVAQIKEVGLNPEDPTVEKWAKKELGINGKELNSILKNNETPEEVKKEVLEKMEAPDELIESVNLELNANKGK